MNKFPKEINNYHEIFLGGGSVLLAFLKMVKNNSIKLHQNVYAYDINESLIYMYKNIQNNHQQLYDTLKIFINEYNECKDKSNEVANRNPSNIEEARSSKEIYYYWIRNKYNKMKKEDKISIEGSAIFIFLNKTCFRGMYREGPNGFNVPYGNYKNPEIINKEHLDEIQLLIKDVIFQCCDYNQSIKKIEKEDFAYFDPPYAPENAQSFVKYINDGFDEKNHLNLFKLINELDNNKIKIMMSNSSVDLVHNNFPLSKYNIEIVECKRSINAKNPESKTNEVIIKNYQ